MGTVDAAGRPHSTPVWGVWHTDDTFWFSCAPSAFKARNLRANPYVAITTDSTDTDRDSDHNQEDSMNQQDVPTELTEMPQDPVVTLLLQDGSSRTFMVNEGSNIIGRSNDADFRLPDTGVSRQHAEITWDGQDAVLVDLESTNGTTVNDTPVENWLLADGDVITVGHSHIEVRIVDPTKTAGR